MIKWSGNIEDKELGIIRVRTNMRACHIIFRSDGGTLVMTVPPNITRRDIDAAIDSFRPQLGVLQEKIGTPVPINFDYRIDAPLFHFSLVKHKLNRYMLRYDYQTNGIVINCPEDTDFGDIAIQQFFRKVIEKALKQMAKIVLPIRLENISKKCRLSYSEVRVMSAKTRWGSCSSSKKINLNCYLLLLPLHLLDMVLIHELCHTVEMNHGPKFWAMMDHFTDHKANELQEEIKKYHTNV